MTAQLREVTAPKGAFRCRHILPPTRGSRTGLSISSSSSLQHPGRQLLLRSIHRGLEPPVSLLFRRVVTWFNSSGYRMFKLATAYRSPIGLLKDLHTVDPAHPFFAEAVVCIVA